MKVQVSVHGQRLSDLEHRIDQLEREKRKSKLIINGVREREEEDTAEIVEKIFADVGVDYKTRVCINIFRRGRHVRKQQDGKDKDKQSRPRPIVVVFLRQTEKSKFFKNLKNLQGNEKWSRVFFNDDLTELQQIEQRDLRSLAAYAKKIGREATVWAGALWFEGRKYYYSELHRLPEDLTLLKAKTLSILNDSAIVFQSPHSPLSNLFPSNLHFRGECFLSAEGAYQSHRALISGYEKEAELM